LIKSSVKWGATTSKNHGVGARAGVDLSKITAYSKKG
jgi:hypothetical protein